MYVDTGAGCERLSMILDQKKSLYETDALKYLIDHAQTLSG
jgi:alanyl-tRNA synthetase